MNLDVDPPGLWMIIPCAGSGSRSGKTVPKQYVPLAGKMLIEHTVDACMAVDGLEKIVLAVAPNDDVCEKHFAAHPMINIARCGGETRSATVKNSLRWLLNHGARPNDWVLVHDAARCLITPELIKHFIHACQHDDVGGLLAIPLADTLKNEDAQRAIATPSRDHKWLAQTPQMFHIQPLLNALNLSKNIVTDEASAMENIGIFAKVVQGSPSNFKVTYPEDFELAHAILSHRHPPQGNQYMSIRIGEGWDIHRLVEHRPLILGGVFIPYEKGLLGHSDADALLHAITDALLGAAGMGDIGTHFSDTDERNKGIDSSVMLKKVVHLVHAAHWTIVNVDCTIIAQSPKMAPHIPAIRSRIAQVLGTPENTVNIKAKTYEKLGVVGEGLAIEARAICALASTSLT